VLASAFGLIAACAGIAAALVAFAGVDPITAFLATTPGGADSIAIIAASTRADASFVMAMQTARFVAVLTTGPALARLAARWLRASA
jgi:membrane AbrB-like protein